MAKLKKVASKPKKKSTKYSKLLAVAAKELAARKKALVLAERKLAGAKRTHEELIADVARLDMVERSLKALVEGTEPPQNVRYIYQYPQWVWYPSPYIQYTLPPYQQQQGNWQGNTVVTTVSQGNQYTYTNTGSLPNVQTFTANCSNNIPALSGNLILNSCSSSLTADSVLESNPAITTSNGGSNLTFITEPGPASDGIVIDLTTHAEETTDAPEPEKEAVVEIA